MHLARVAIMIGPKGRGSNMLAIAHNAADGRIPAEVSLIISPKLDSHAAIGAREMGLRVEHADPNREGYTERLLELLQLHKIEFICLAGYLRLLPKEVLAAYPNRILNIHPALLPKFGGKGMYGRHVHEAVLAARELESGCTVHFVTENYDEGPPILQKRCPVEPGDTPESLALRVLRLEHVAFSEALAKVIRDTQAEV